MTENPAVPTPASATPHTVNFLWAANLAWTLALLTVNVLEFTRGGAWSYHGPGSLIYFALLAAYAGMKEAHNWTVGEDAAEAKGRKGVLFVGVWVAFSLVAFLAVNFAQGFIFPHELSSITIEVLAIFFGTQASRSLRRGRRKASPGSDDLSLRILQMAQARGGARTDEFVDALGASRNEVQYALRKLVKARRMRKVSAGKNDPDTKYEPV